MRATVLSNKITTGLRNNQDHCTPEFLWRAISEFNKIVLDPCSNMWSTVLADKTYSLDLDEDGLVEPWPDGGLIYLNPPFGNLRPWVDRCNTHIEHVRGTVGACHVCEIIMVCPFAPQTRWFRSAWAGEAACVAAWPRRIAWEGAGKRPAFATALFYWGRCKDSFFDWAKSHNCVLFDKLS